MGSSFQETLNRLALNDPCLTLLMLANHPWELGNDGCRKLAAALKTNKNVVSISLEGNQISNISSFMETLSSSMIFSSPLSGYHLQTLNLSRNPIGDAGAQALALYFTMTTRTAMSAHAPESNGPLPEVTKAAFDCPNAGLGHPHRQGHALKRLILEDCGIGDTGACALAQALAHNTSLKVLNLRGNPNIGVAGKSALLECVQRYNKTIHDISLHYNDYHHPYHLLTDEEDGNSEQRNYSPLSSHRPSQQQRQEQRQQQQRSLSPLVECQQIQDKLHIYLGLNQHTGRHVWGTESIPLHWRSQQWPIRALLLCHESNDENTVANDHAQQQKILSKSQVFLTLRENPTILLAETSSLHERKIGKENAMRHSSLT